MKKILTLIMTLIMVAALSVTAFAASISEETAVDKALSDAGLSRSEITGLETEKERGRYEIEFRKTSDNTEYDYEISASDGKVLDKSVEYVYERTSSKKKIGTKAARVKAAKAAGVKYKAVKKGTCRYTYKKKFGRYKVKFRTGGYRYEVEIAAAKGDVIELEKEAVKK